MLKQQLNHLNIPAFRGRVQQRPSIVIYDYNISPMLEK